MSARLAFIKPLVPTSIARPPDGDDWLHEPKWDGFRFQIIKSGSDVRLYSKHCADYSERLPRMTEHFTQLPARSAIVDGELCLLDAWGGAHFWRLMAQMRTRRPDEAQLVFLAFDLLHQDGVDLRALALVERKRDLHRLCSKMRSPFMREVEVFPNGALLLAHCNKFRFEGVVSKRAWSRYTSGPSRHWFKAKCPDWKREHAERWRAFEKKPEPSEDEVRLKRKRAELARLRERLKDPDLRAGLTREARNSLAVLEREIAELEGKA